MVVIETERLHFRSVEASDSDDYLDLFSNRRVIRYFGKRRVWNREKVDTYLAKQIDRQEAGDPLHALAIHLKSNGEFIGHAILGHTSHPGEASIAYAFLPEHWGKGYATETVTSLIRQYNVQTITATIHPANRPSVRVLKKAGFTRAASPPQRSGRRHFYILTLESE